MEITTKAYKISEQKPPHGEKVLFWDDYGEQWLAGEYRNYDGKWVLVSHRHGWWELELLDFTHWIPMPPAPTTNDG